MLRPNYLATGGFSGAIHKLYDKKKSKYIGRYWVGSSHTDREGIGSLPAEVVTKLKFPLHMDCLV